MSWEKKIVIVILWALFFTLSSIDGYAETSSNPGTSAKPGGDGAVSGSGTATPDLFTGTMSYSIPIEVPAGRKGMQPELVLTYRSNSGNGWVGMGWDLDMGAIERSARNGINWDDNTSDFILRVDGSAIDLVNVSGEYREIIESSFIRIRKMTAGDGKISWEATDRTGTRYLYGQTAASRQDNLNDGSKIFKWCLDYVEDANGNYMVITYEKNPENAGYKGQIYPKQIDYTGNTNTGTGTTNFVHFYLEPRSDAPVMYSTNFAVTTTHRLKTMDQVHNEYGF